MAGKLNLFYAGQLGTIDRKQTHLAAIAQATGGYRRRWGQNDRLTACGCREYQHAEVTSERRTDFRPTPLAPLF